MPCETICVTAFLKEALYQSNRSPAFVVCRVAMDEVPPLEPGVPLPRPVDHLVVEAVAYHGGRIYIVASYVSGFWQPRTRIILVYSHWGFNGVVSIPVIM